MADNKQNIASVSPSELRMKQIYDGLIKRDISHEDAIAILANIGHETAGTYDPSIKQQNVGKVSDPDWWKPTKSGRGTGLMQWDGSRRLDLKKFAEDRGKNWDDIETQLDFIKHELTGTESAAYDALKKAKTSEEKTKIILKKYERPGVPAEKQRLNILKDINQKFPTPPKLPGPIQKEQTKKFKDTYSSLGKQKPLMFPSSYEEDEEDEDEDDNVVASSDLNEDDKLPTSLAQTSEEDEDEDDKDSLKPSRFSGLRKIIS